MQENIRHFYIIGLRWSSDDTTSVQGSIAQVVVSLNNTKGHPMLAAYYVLPSLNGQQNRPLFFFS